MIFIGEIGINHNGNIKTALELIEVAKKCGVDVVKFQKREPDICVPESQKSMKRVWNGKEMTYLEYKKELEFSEVEYDVINKYCKKLRIQWTASVWDVKSVEFMKRYTKDIPFIKIPSACITDLELLEAINDWDIPVIISDGMSTEEEINQAVNTLNNLVCVMHCNSSYPCSDNELDLNVLVSYKRKYKDKLLVGYSGHEIDTLPTLLSVSMGAEVVERHITLEKSMEGTDHKCSLNPYELNELMTNLRRIPDILGNYHVSVYDSELKIREKLRK